jgi:hypothetical protein
MLLIGMCYVKTIHDFRITEKKSLRYDESTENAKNWLLIDNTLSLLRFTNMPLNNKNQVVRQVLIFFGLSFLLLGAIYLQYGMFCKIVLHISKL